VCVISPLGPTFYECLTFYNKPLRNISLAEESNKGHGARLEVFGAVNIQFEVFLGCDTVLCCGRIPTFRRTLQHFSWLSSVLSRESWYITV